MEQEKMNSIHHMIYRYQIKNVTKVLLNVNIRISIESY